MFERIVVGFDESDGSRDALALAKRLCDRLGADLVLVGVIPEPTGGSLVPALPADAFTNLSEQARAGIEKAAAELGADSEIIRSSSAARGLEELTETLEGDLLVLGSPGPTRAPSGPATRPGCCCREQPALSPLRRPASGRAKPD